MEDRFNAFVFVSLMAVVWIAAVAFYVTDQQDCAARGGVLVDDAVGLGWQCVEPNR